MKHFRNSGDDCTILWMQFNAAKLYTFKKRQILHYATKKIVHKKVDGKENGAREGRKEEKRMIGKSARGKKQLEEKQREKRKRRGGKDLRLGYPSPKHNSTTTVTWVLSLPVSINNLQLLQQHSFYTPHPGPSHCSRIHSVCEFSPYNGGPRPQYTCHMAHADFSLQAFLWVSESGGVFGSVERYFRLHTQEEVLLASSGWRPGMLLLMHKTQ